MSFSASFKFDDAGMKKLKGAMSPAKMARVLFTSVEWILIPRIRERIKKNESVDTGNLFRNLKARVAVGDKVAVDVGSIGVGYGLDVEEGREPHTPDIDKLAGWAKRKLGAKNPIATARVIAAKIKKVGIEPRPYLMVTYERYKTDLKNDFFKRARGATGT